VSSLRYCAYQPAAQMSYPRSVSQRSRFGRNAEATPPRPNGNTLDPTVLRPLSTGLRTPGPPSRPIQPLLRYLNQRSSSWENTTLLNPPPPSSRLTLGGHQRRDTGSRRSCLPAKFFRPILGREYATGSPEMFDFDLAGKIINEELPGWTEVLPPREEMFPFDDIFSEKTPVTKDLRWIIEVLGSVPDPVRRPRADILRKRNQTNSNPTA